MKKLFVFLAVALSTTIMAQKPERPQEKKVAPTTEEKVAMQLNSISEEIELTQQEKEKLTVLYTNTIKEREALEQKFKLELNDILGKERARKVLKKNNRNMERGERPNGNTPPSRR